MPSEFQINDADIAFAESMLLPEGKYFDDERRKFIRNLKTVDLQAVPGSGKTTALLAKLLVLDRHLSHSDNQGVLVISHTNAAVNEISDCISSVCPKLFTYPNFVGTIQRFVDTFLAIPMYVSLFKKRPDRIDNDSYRHKANQFQKTNLNGYSRHDQNRAKYFLNNNQCCSTYRLSLENNQLVPIKSISEGRLNIKKPRPNSKGYKGWDEHETKRVSSWLVDYKKSILRDGILCYDDAYLLAELALASFPLLLKLIPRRFRYVFVDEMQDMAPHQYRLLERMFGDEAETDTIFQRIGDSDQAIFGGKNFIDTEGWRPRAETLTLSNSLRLPPRIANILPPFAYERDTNFEIIGLQDAEISPHLLIYDDDSIGFVVERYAQLIEKFQQKGSIPLGLNSRYMAIAWNSVWDEAPDPRDQKYRLIDFYPSFRRSKLRKQEEFETLADYIFSIDMNDKTLNSAHNAILRGVCQALRLGNVIDPRNDRPFSPKSLTSYFRHEVPQEKYQRFSRILLKWSIQVIEGKFKTTHRAMRLFIPKIIQYFGGTCEDSLGFLTGAQTVRNENTKEQEKDPNTLRFGDIEIGIGTVHSVKGQTHTTTLYIESSYQNDGGKMYESQRLAAQFKGENLSPNSRKRVKESAKMVYVGFSRPTHLLVFAVHKKNFDTYLSDLDSKRWEVISAFEERGIN